MPDYRPLVAIVDDEEAVRTALGRLCRAYGLDTRIFATAQQMLDSLDDLQPDCVILDVQMPGVSGVDAQGRMHDRGLHIPVIMITGREDDDLRVRARSAGASAYLYKPLDVDLLMGAIHDAIGNGDDRTAQPLSQLASFDRA